MVQQLGIIFFIFMELQDHAIYWVWIHLFCLPPMSEERRKSISTELEKNPGPLVSQTTSQTTSMPPQVFVICRWKLLIATNQVFLDIRATMKDLTDFGSLDHLVQQLPPVQRDHSHDDGVLHKLKNVTVVDQAHLWNPCRGCGSSVCLASQVTVLLYWCGFRCSGIRW